MCRALLLLRFRLLPGLLLLPALPRFLLLLLLPVLPVLSVVRAGRLPHP
jgi:hypothetical protein